MSQWSSLCVTCQQDPNCKWLNSAQSLRMVFFWADPRGCRSKALSVRGSLEVRRGASTWRQEWRRARRFASSLLFTGLQRRLRRRMHSRSCPGVTRRRSLKREVIGRPSRAVSPLPAFFHFLRSAMKGVDLWVCQKYSMTYARHSQWLLLFEKSHPLWDHVGVAP